MVYISFGLFSVRSSIRFVEITRKLTEWMDERLVRLVVVVVVNRISYLGLTLLCASRTWTLSGRRRKIGGRMEEGPEPSDVTFELYLNR